MRSDLRKVTSRVKGRTQYAEPTLTVLLDPGHGGDDTGAVWQFPDKSLLFEKDVNLRVVQMMIDKIAPHIDVRLTRFDDRHISLRERALVPYHYDLLVSVHCNAIDRPKWDTVQGTEVYVRALEDAPSVAIAKMLVTPVAESLGITPNKNPIRSNKGLRVLSLAHQILDRFGRSRSCLAIAPNSPLDAPKGMRSFGTPAVLVELGYVTSERDRASLMATEGQRAAASAIAEVINSCAPLPSSGQAVPITITEDDHEEDLAVLEDKKEGGKKRGKGRPRKGGLDIEKLASEV